jgi:transposase
LASTFQVSGMVRVMPRNRKLVPVGELTGGGAGGGARIPIAGGRAVWPLQPISKASPGGGQLRLSVKPPPANLIRSTGKSVGQAARELDLTETAVCEWVKRADLDAGRRTDGLTTTEQDELRRLRRENRELREEREILPKATVFLARETGHR